MDPPIKAPGSHLCNLSSILTCVSMVPSSFLPLFSTDSLQYAAVWSFVTVSFSCAVFSYTELTTASVLFNDRLLVLAISRYAPFVSVRRAGAVRPLMVVQVIRRDGASPLCDGAPAFLTPMHVLTTKIEQGGGWDCAPPRQCLVGNRVELPHGIALDGDNVRVVNDSVADRICQRRIVKVFMSAGMLNREQKIVEVVWFLASIISSRSRASVSFNGYSSHSYRIKASGYLYFFITSW